jgi:hypothetical protein
VRIFPKVADHEKKADLEAAWVRHTHFQGKRVHIGRDKEWKKDETLNRPLFRRDPLKFVFPASSL